MSKITHAKQINLKECKSVLVVAPEGLENILLSTPAMSALREAMPKDSKITMIVNEEDYQIAVNNRCVDEIYVLKTKNPAIWLKSASRLIGRQFDVMITTRREASPAIAAALLTRAKARIGYSPENKHPLYDMLYRLQLHTIDAKQHRIVRYLNLVRFIGANSYDFMPRLAIPEQDKKYAVDFLQKSGITASDTLIGMHPTPLNENNRWSLNKYAQLMANLDEKYGAKVLVFYHEEEKSRLEEFMHVTKNKGILVDTQDRMKQASIARFLSCFVCNETDFMHLFAPFTNLVLIWGESDPDLSKPSGYNHKILKAEDGHAESVPLSGVTEHIKNCIQR